MEESLPVSELQSKDTDSPIRVTEELELPTLSEVQLLTSAPHRRRGSRAQLTKPPCSVRVRQTAINARTTFYSLVLAPGSQHSILPVSSSLLVIELLSLEAVVLLTKGERSVRLAERDHVMADKGERVDVRNMDRGAARLTIYEMQW